MDCVPLLPLVSGSPFQGLLGVSESMSLYRISHLSCLCCILGEFLSSITQFINFLLDYAHSRIYSIPSFINFNKNSCISKHFTWFYSCPITCVSFRPLFHNFCSLFMSTTINYSLKLISSWMHSCEHLPSLLAVFLKIN